MSNWEPDIDEDLDKIKEAYAKEDRVAILSGLIAMNQKSYNFLTMLLEVELKKSSK